MWSAVHLDVSLNVAINHDLFHVTTHVRNFSSAYSRTQHRFPLQSHPQRSDNVALDLSLSLETALVLSVSIISTAGLSVPPDLHDVLAFKERITVLKTLKIE